MKSDVQATVFQDALPAHKLLVSAVVLLDHGDTVELQRGAAIKDVNGVAVGVVAAVVMDCRTREVTHVLLGKVPPTAVYRLIPLSLIQSMIEGSLWLGIDTPVVSKLPCYKPA
jgi:hypothetical protein